jgi:hypothetical protein
MFPFASVLGFWGSNTAETPVISVPIAPMGGTFAPWDIGGPHDEAGHWHSENCNWWNGTHYYDPGVCNAFSITRVSSSDIDHALERASHCVKATAGESECVLNGEIGFAVPSLFLWDDDKSEMRMLIAPRYVAQEDAGLVKTIRMQDPMGPGIQVGNVYTHPNQLFEFNTTVKIEYLKGGARSMATEELTGQAAYCVQALRRSIAPACWEALD